MPDDFFRDLLMSTNNLYRNWFKGKENEEFDSRMTDRANKILSIFKQTQTKFHSEIRRLLTHISRDDSKTVYIEMVKSNKYDQEQMLMDAFYTYDTFNEIHELLKDLEKAQKNVNDQETAENITQLRDEVIRLYMREMQEVS